MTGGVEAIALSERSWAIAPERRGQGLATEFMNRLRRRFAGRAFVIPAFAPEELGAAWFRRGGWRETPIAQFEMALDLAA